jgi:GDP-mannose 6-dehydrogenase
MLPGSTEAMVIPALESTSGRRAGVDFGVAVNPEFLREGIAVYDFNHPARTVVGEINNHSGDLVASLYEHMDAPVVRTDLRTAEIVKYTDNAFHAVKIAFANEIGNLCKRQGVDGSRVMEIFALDTKLNLSPVYLRPGFAFGGSCLPKDLRAVIHRAGECTLRVPLLEAALFSNELQKQLALEMITRTDRRRIGILGLTFKSGTDDLRESAAVDLIERLVGKGYILLAYDRHVLPSNLIGANLAYMQRETPYLPDILRNSMAEVIAESEVVVIANDEEEFRRVPELAQNGQIVIDLVRALETPNNLGDRYRGICW